MEARTVEEELDWYSSQTSTDVEETHAIIIDVGYTVMGQTTVCCLRTVWGFEVTESVATLNSMQRHPGIARRLALRKAMKRLQEFEQYRKAADRHRGFSAL